MNYFKVISLLFLLILLSCSRKTTISFKNISKEIAKKSYEKGLTEKKKDFFYKIRNQLNEKAEFDILLKEEEFFLLESFKYENGLTYGMLWSKTDTIKYTFFRGQISTQTKESDYFSAELIGLISKWDIAAIKNKKPSFPEQIIFSSRVNMMSDLKIEVEKFFMF